MAALIINVSGTSTISRTAERAIVTIFISKQGLDQTEVNSSVTKTANDLQKDLKQLSSSSHAATLGKDAPPVAKWTMSSLSTGSYYVFLDGKHWDGTQKKERHHRASATFEITFSDFASLGPACTDLANIEHVSISSIRWQLTEATRKALEEENRTKAVQDAVAKASQFAKAVGKLTVTPVEMNDGSSGALNPSFGGGGLFGAAAPTRTGALGARHDPSESLNFEPEELSVQCSVNCKFEAE